jgi:peptide chain release factor 3
VATVSDWMDIERERGISITSAALQFTYRDAVINLVDTPGHADFSEDTYRVLSAVDAAVMLVDAAKGLEIQTMKLFEVCKHRNIPIITVINKWDRAGKDPLDLMDEIQDRTGLQPAPLNWPVGIAGDFRGVLDMATGEYTKFTRTDGGATVATEEHFSADAAEAIEGEAWRQAVEESDLIVATGAGVDPEGFLAATSTPVMFGSAVLNFGVRFLLDTLVDLAPAPGARPDADGVLREIDSPFSAFVFKVQAGMDVAHRDRLAFVRICSGTFERGMIVTHSGTNRPFATKYAQQVMGRERHSIDRAFPGDVVGLVNANALRVGDTLFVDEPVTFPPIPSFSPEHFAVARAKDTSRYKQFRRGIEQLDHEGRAEVRRLVGRRRRAASSASPQRIVDISAHQEAGNDVVVVVSAMGDTTDELLDLAGRSSPAAAARASSTCCSPPASASRWRCWRWRSPTSASRPARSPARQAGVITDSVHGKARIIDVTPGRIRSALDEGASRSSPASRASARTPRTSPRSAAAARTPPRSRSPPRSGRRLRDLHRRRRRLHRRPADRAQRPQDRPASPTRRCSRWPPTGPRCCTCAASSTPAASTCRSTCGRRSPTARGPGRRRLNR